MTATSPPRLQATQRSGAVPAPEEILPDTPVIALPLPQGSSVVYTLCYVRVDREREPGASVWEVSRHVTWKRRWDNLPGFLKVSALRQVEMHLQYLAAEAEAPAPAAP